MEVPKYFEDLPDFRVQGRCLHRVSDIVMLVLVGFIADCEDFEEVEDFGRDKQAYLQTFLELSNGIPSHDTMNRVFRHLDASGRIKSLPLMPPLVNTLLLKASLTSRQTT